jgi:D-tyrosyl-tRNA(Tyr) deacylase
MLRRKENVMKFLIQRVNNASVTVEGEVIGSINKGLLVFVGVYDGDTKEIADKLVKKLVKMRIFADDEGKTNLDITSVGGELLIVSQFTLCADCKKGNRPSFVKAGAPDMANEMYEYIIRSCSEQGIKVQHGEFGADMRVDLSNDGPFTILLDSDDL